jgi:hypothetical protein
MVMMKAVLMGDGSIALKNVPGTIERGRLGRPVGGVPSETPKTNYSRQPWWPAVFEQRQLRGVRPVKGSSYQKRSPHLCEDCSERPYTVDGLEYRSTLFPVRYCWRKSRVPRRM